MNTSLSEWAENNTYLGKRKFKISKAYEFQRAILDDLHPHLVGIKLSQVGFTEIQIRKALAFLHKYDGSTLMYTVPDLKMQKQLSSTRLKPIINASEILAKGPNDTRTSELFQFSNSFLHCVHCVESNATSIPADFIMNDELDLSDQEIVTLFNSRLQNSDFKIKQRFSTPTFTGFGVDADYQLSDQREFMLKCSSCNHWQAPDYEWKFLNMPGRTEEMDDIVTDIDDSNVLNLDLTNACVICEKCGKPLNLEGEREWVATYPSRTQIRGYRIRPFTTSRITVPYIVTTMNEYRRKQALRRGVNTVLGRPYEDGDVRLQLADIKKAFGNAKVPEIGKEVPVYVGADIGITCHIALGIDVGGEVHPFKVFTCPSNIFKETMRVIMEKYNVVAGGVDRYPYTPTVNDVRDESERVIVPMAYIGNKTFAPSNDAGGELDYYQINRTYFADSVSENIRKGKMKIHGYTDFEVNITAHLRDMFRDDSGDQGALWRKMSGNDHFFHTFMYLQAAYHIKNSDYLGVDNPNVMLETVVQDLKYYTDGRVNCLC